jgi:hypothetical protein
VAVLIGTSVITGALSVSAVARPAEPFRSSVSSTAATTAPACTVDRVLEDPRIVESSGLAHSSRFPGVLLTHNDKGDTARYFAVDETGSTKAVVTLGNVTAIDWEDIAVGPNNMVWLGDIGDNYAERTTISVYRVREPTQLSDQTAPWTRFRFSYPGGPRDAEALLVQPSTARLYVVSKERDGTAAIYRAPGRLSSTGTNQLERIRMGIPNRITAGDFSPGGSTFVLRDYTQGYVYPSFTGKPQVVALPDQPQGESATYTRTGGALLVGSEGTNSRVCRVPLP